MVPIKVALGIQIMLLIFATLSCFVIYSFQIQGFRSKSNEVELEISESEEKGYDLDTLVKLPMTARKDRLQELLEQRYPKINLRSGGFKVDNNPFAEIETSLVDDTDALKLDFFTNSNLHIKPLNKKKLTNVGRLCRNLPKGHRFKTKTISRTPITVTQANLFHVILLYPELSAKHLCVIEGLISSINADSRKSDVKLIIWISSEAGAVISALDKDVFDVVLQMAQFEMEFVFLNPDEMFQETPLEGFYNCMRETKQDLGTFEKQNIGNAVRLALIYKFGGMYLDWDFMVSGNPLDLNQALGFQSQTGNLLNNAAMKFEKGSKILLEIINEFIRDYDGNIWAHNGPNCMKRTFQKRLKCHQKGLSRVTHTCDLKDGQKEDIQFWGEEKFYPLPYEGCKLVLLPVEELDETLIAGSTLIHLWNHFLSPLETEACRANVQDYTASTVGRLRTKFCPSTFNHMTHFGNCTF